MTVKEFSKKTLLFLFKVAYLLAFFYIAFVGLFRLFMAMPGWLFQGPVSYATLISSQLLVCGVLWAALFYAGKKFIQSKAFRRENLSAFTLAATGALLMSLALNSMSLSVKTVYSKPKHCDPIVLESVSTCSGYLIGGWQNSSIYEMIASGPAQKPLCRVFQSADFSDSIMADAQGLDGFEKVFKITTRAGSHCDETKPGQYWTQTPCPWETENTACYHCTRFLSNGNSYRYGVIGFSPDCTSGQYIWIAHHSHKEFLDRVAKLLNTKPPKPRPVLDNIQWQTDD